MKLYNYKISMRMHHTLLAAVWTYNWRNKYKYDGYRYYFKFKHSNINKVRLYWCSCTFRYEVCSYTDDRKRIGQAGHSRSWLYQRALRYQEIVFIPGDRDSYVIWMVRPFALAAYEIDRMCCATLSQLCILRDQII